MEDTMENKMREQFIIKVDKISEILNSTDETDSVCEYILKGLSNISKCFQSQMLLKK